MKKVSLKQFTEETTALLEVAQSERVVVTEKGKPLAVVLGLKYKDEEDYALERDTAFWQMIHERRKKNKGVPLAEVKRQLGLDKPAPRRKAK
jgi:hypothetical protein